MGLNEATANTPPVAVDDTNAGDPVVESGVFPGDPFASGNVLANDIDPDPNPGLHVTSVSGVGLGHSVTGTYGSVLVSGDGLWTYSLDDSAFRTNALRQGEPAFDRFTYTVEDAQGASSSATLTIEISGTQRCAARPQPVPFLERRHRHDQQPVRDRPGRRHAHVRRRDRTGARHRGSERRWLPLFLRAGGELQRPRQLPVLRFRRARRRDPRVSHYPHHGGGRRARSHGAARRCHDGRERAGRAGYFRRAQRHRRLGISFDQHRGRALRRLLVCRLRRRRGNVVPDARPARRARC